MNCKKCDSPKTVTLRKKDNYCTECFLLTTNHKFRACLGKNKVITPNENVLICLSGGLGSTVLLDLIYYGLSLDSNKKLRIVPYFLHLFDERNKYTADVVLKQCKNYEAQVYIAHISNYMKNEIDLPELNCTPNTDKKDSSEFYDMLNSLPSSTANDFLFKVKRSLYIRYAKKLQCNTVFTAETTNTLAINLLSNIAIGRGSQVESDVGFSDTREKNIKILRPVKDISKEELCHYIKIKQIGPVCESNMLNHSLQSVIKQFIEDLQDNFQSTISTVCKTADKIGVSDDHVTNNCCLVCKSEIYKQEQKLSALEATNFSRTVSQNHNKSDDDIGCVEYNGIHATMFPFIHTHLCYACSRNYSETDQTKLPQHVQTLFKS